MGAGERVNFVHNGAGGHGCRGAGERGKHLPQCHSERSEESRFPISMSFTLKERDPSSFFYGAGDHVRSFQNDRRRRYAPLSGLVHPSIGMKREKTIRN